MKEPLNSQIVGHLLDYIRQARLAPGDLLPPENVLIEELQVSRVVLREGLSYLKALNLVTSRRGSGYRVQTGSFSGALTTVMHAMTRSGLTELEELHNLRKILETGAIAQAVSNANAEDHQNVINALRELESISVVDNDQALQKYTLAELHFHQALLRPARCHTLEIINRALEDFFSYRTELTSSPIRMSAAAVARTNLFHRALADAFLAGEAAAAMLLLCSHLNSHK